MTNSPEWLPKLPFSDGLNNWGDFHGIGLAAHSVAAIAENVRDLLAKAR